MKLHPSVLLSTIGIVLIGLFVMASGAAAAFYLQPKGRLSCADFGSYSDIPSDWKITMPWLDHNHDGIPCNRLYNLQRHG